MHFGIVYNSSGTVKSGLATLVDTHGKLELDRSPNLTDLVNAIRRLFLGLERMCLRLSSSREIHPFLACLRATENRSCRNPFWLVYH